MTARITRVVPLLALLVSAACADTPTRPGVAASAKAAQPVSAGVTLACPSGWSERERGRGVLLCLRPGTFDAIAFVDLSRGARVMSLSQGLSAASSSNRSPQFRRNSIGDWWSTTHLTPSRFCVFNGGFYQAHATTTELTFPFKLNWSLKTAGAHTTTLPRRVLTMDGDRASIRPYTESSRDFDRVNRALPAQHAIVGYSTSVGGGRNIRTYLGVRDGNRDGAMETVMVYIAFGTLENAHSFLRGLGSADVVQLDGGPSSQFMCANTHLRTVRPIPHALALYGARS
ncbi:MAG: hypothetical protein AVDCRST_MAG68-881 [uncultured Gemmatimonadetes bacterium]|uniref:Phosphodiester glycosidase domain-containing protein n=1 Tax=uncultured Gemmatimonadota bacterium TaxID=203437 RepID=A0A6J4KER5_9BACT|nr:MAG: hypothetical protein AVDCRST_MAG68-881 [uncultured Gemmatimonadota bacterium]